MTPRRPFARIRSPLPLLLAMLVSLLTTPAPAAAYAEQRPAGGRWPLDPEPAVVTPFDPPATAYGRGHRGVDLAGSIGQPVRSALAGRVSFVGTIAGVGVVVVGHGDTRTTYQPVAPRVGPGEEVLAGTVLGTLSWFGTHCLPRACLHWGWIRDATYLDPLLLVDAPRPVRLLPQDGSPVRHAPDPTYGLAGPVVAALARLAGTLPWR